MNENLEEADRQTLEAQETKPDAKQPTASGGDQKSRAQRLSITLGDIRSATTSIFLIVFLAALLVAVGLELFRNTVNIEPIQVPKDLADKGYTPEVVAQRLGDKILEIRKDAQTLKTLRAEGRGQVVPDVSLTALPEKRLVDIDVPGTGIPVRSLLRYIRDFLGIHEETIRGEITHEGKKLRLRLRVGSHGAVPDPPARSETELEDLLHLGARGVIRAIDPYILAVYLLDRRSDREGAFDLIVHCLENDPKDDDAWAYNLWGDMLRGEGQYEEAIEKYEAAIRQKPDFPTAYSNWGQVLARQGAQEKAIDKFKRGIEIDPNHTGSYFQWGDLLQREGNYAEAAKKYQKVVELDPDDRIARTNVGLMLSHQKNYEEAFKIYKEISLKYPTYAGVYFGWSRSLYDQRKFDDAINKLKEAIKLEPNMSEAYNNWGYMLLDQENYEEAIQKFKKAIDLSHSFADPYYNWGRALEKQRLYKEAKEKFKKAFDLRPKEYGFLKEKIEK